MKQIFKTKGTCSSQIELEVADGKIVEVSFEGGCNGNLKGLSSLVIGLTPQEVCSKLEGINCGKRTTSCLDQLCKALKAMGY